MRKIVLYPDARLRRVSPRVMKWSRDLETKVGELSQILLASQGVGLAAPQAGLKERFFLTKIKDRIGVHINPEFEVKKGDEKIGIKMVDKEGKQSDFLEGCLSFPGYWGTVKRYLKIKAGWLEIKKGKLVKKEKLLKGLEAVVFQHELDHVDGILFIDHIKKESGKLYFQAGEEMKAVSVEELSRKEKGI